MASRDFIRRIARKIEEVSGEEPIFFPKTLPKEVWFSSDDLARERGTGPIVLRTAEQTKNMEIVELKRFDPYFLNKDVEIFCCKPGCSVTRKFVHERETQEKSEKVKRDSFLCKAHCEELMSRVLECCTEENVTVDVDGLKKDDFTDYTSLISVLEKAIFHLKSKWLRSGNDFLFEEIFLNTRNYLIIANALINSDESNTATVLGPYLTVLLKVFEDPNKLKSGLELLMTIMVAILFTYGITYNWIHIPSENRGAKIGAVVGFLSALFALLTKAENWILSQLNSD